jgi:hypothetical protein
MYIKVNGEFYKLSIVKKSNNTLVFTWISYGTDQEFQKVKDQEYDCVCFQTAFDKSAAVVHD